eukprot:6771809-Lingulodinium_polyedra.AAC.1
MGPARPCALPQPAPGCASRRPGEFPQGFRRPAWPRAGPSAAPPRHPRAARAACRAEDSTRDASDRARAARRMRHCRRGALRPSRAGVG